MIPIFLIFVNRRWNKGGIYSEYEKYIAFDFKPEESGMPSDKLMEAIEEELEVLPLVDVMGQQDSQLRQSAIQVMKRLPKADAVRLLRLSLTDKNVENAFFAAFQLSEIEAEINEDITMARKEVERIQDSPGSRLSLANTYSEYHESGILDEITAKHYRELAFQEYQKTLELGGDDPKVLNYLGNLEVKRENYDNALSFFERVLAKDSLDIYAHVGVIQAYYEKGEIPKVIEYARQIADKMPRTKGPMREIINYWAA